MKKYKFCSLVLIFSIIFFSCSEDLNEEEITPALMAELQKLPEATQVGANTCGCILNGKAWIANLPPSDTLENVFSIGQYTNWFAIPLNESDTMSITSRRWPTPRVTNVAHDVIKNLGFAYIETGKYKYHSSYSPKNLVTITFSKYDLENLIMSGSFYMKLYPLDSLAGKQPVLEAKYCRFDFRFTNF